MDVDDIPAFARSDERGSLKYVADFGACEGCRKAKAKCDRGMPRCSRCIKYGIDTCIKKCRRTSILVNASASVPLPSSSCYFLPLPQDGGGSLAADGTTSQLQQPHQLALQPSSFSSSFDSVSKSSASLVEPRRFAEEYIVSFLKHAKHFNDEATECKGDQGKAEPSAFSTKASSSTTASSSSLASSRIMRCDRNRLHQVLQRWSDLMGKHGTDFTWGALSAIQGVMGITTTSTTAIPPPCCSPVSAAASATGISISEGQGGEEKEGRTTVGSTEKEGGKESCPHHHQQEGGEKKASKEQESPPSKPSSPSSSVTSPSNQKGPYVICSGVCGRRDVPKELFAWDDGQSAMAIVVTAGPTNIMGLHLNPTFEDMFATSDEMLEVMTKYQCLPEFAIARFVIDEDLSDFSDAIFSASFLSGDSNMTSAIVKVRDRHEKKHLCLVRARFIIRPEVSSGYLALSFMPLPSSRLLTPVLPSCILSGQFHGSQDHGAAMMQHLSQASASVAPTPSSSSSSVPPGSCYGIPFTIPPPPQAYLKSSHSSSTSSSTALPHYQNQISVYAAIPSTSTKNPTTTTTSSSALPPDSCYGIEPATGKQHHGGNQPSELDEKPLDGSVSSTSSIASFNSLLIPDPPVRITPFDPLASNYSGNEVVFEDPFAAANSKERKGRNGGRQLKQEPFVSLDQHPSQPGAAAQQQQQQTMMRKAVPVPRPTSLYIREALGHTPDKLKTLPPQQQQPDDNTTTSGSSMGGATTTSRGSSHRKKAISPSTSPISSSSMPVTRRPRQRRGGGKIAAVDRDIGRGGAGVGVEAGGLISGSSGMYMRGSEEQEIAMGHMIGGGGGEQQQQSIGYQQQRHHQNPSQHQHLHHCLARQDESLGPYAADRRETLSLTDTTSHHHRPQQQQHPILATAAAAATAPAAEDNWFPNPSIWSPVGIVGIEEERHHPTLLSSSSNHTAAAEGIGGRGGGGETPGLDDDDILQMFLDEGNDELHGGIYDDEHEQHQHHHR